MAMIVGTLRLHLLIRGAHSLKDKRRVLKSMKERLRRAFNISIAEIGAYNQHQNAILAIALVGSERRQVNSVLSRILNQIYANPACEVVNQEMEFL